MGCLARWCGVRVVSGAGEAEMGDFAEGADHIGVSFEGAQHLIALPESDRLVGRRYHVTCLNLHVLYQSSIRRP